MKRIYCTYNDTEVSYLSTICKCPHCGNEQHEEDKNDCGTTYIIECEECEENYEMHFDAN